PMDNETFGVTVLLGDADSGIFIDPDAGGWGNSDPNWFLEGKVYGQSGNGSNALLAQVRVTKPNIETYPVHIDLTPLGPTNLTFQYSYGGVVDREETVAGAVGEVTINTSAYLGPRVNPLALMPDGTLGVLIEFKQSPLDGHDAIFVRADGVTQHFDHISRVEAVGGGGLEGFSIVSERLGIFRNRHLIAGLGIFEATNQQLTIKAHASENFGTS